MLPIEANPYKEALAAVDAAVSVDTSTKREASEGDTKRKLSMDDEPKSPKKKVLQKKPKQPASAPPPHLASGSSASVLSPPPPPPPPPAPAPGAPAQQPEKAEPRNRGGIHFQAAKLIESWDITEYIRDNAWRVGFYNDYYLPEPEERRTIAAQITDPKGDWPALEKALYSWQGWSYLIWNRRVFSLNDDRDAIFQALKGDDKQAVDGDDDI